MGRGSEITSNEGSTDGDRTLVDHLRRGPSFDALDVGRSSDLPRDIDLSAASADEDG